MFDKKEYKKQYHKDNKDKIAKYYKQWRRENPEYRKEYYQDNRKKELTQMKKWREDNFEYISQYIKKKYKTDLKFNLNRKIGVLIWKSLKGNKANRHWEDLVGYKLADLFERLQKTMPLGYVWKDFLNGKLQIDHIFPISVFNFNKPEDYDFRRCWSLKNLRLLPARENKIKGNKLTESFQPALKLIIKGVN